MKNISTAFKALEEVCEIDSLPIIKEEVEVEEFEITEETTLRELFKHFGDYVFNFVFGGEDRDYIFFVEALGGNGAESCSILFDEFNIENISGALIELLNRDYEFIDSLANHTSEDFTLDTTVAEMVELAKLIEPEDELGVEIEEPEFEEEEVIAEESLTEEESPEAFYTVVYKYPNGRDWESEHLVLSELGGLSEEELVNVVFDKEISSRQAEDGLDGVTILVKKFADGNEEVIKEYTFPTVEAIKEKGRHKFSHKKELKEEVLDVASKEEMEEAKEILKKPEEENIEQIVDISAEAADDLKKTYIGDAILMCPVCKTMIYKGLDDLVKAETQEGEPLVTAEGEQIYNDTEECPHCGAKDGYTLVGQVATLDAKEPNEEVAAEEAEKEEEHQDEEGEPAPRLEKPEEIEVEEEEKVEFEPKAEESLEQSNNFKDVILESFDENALARLVRIYLHKTYSNISDFTITEGAIKDADNQLIFEGIIKFKSGKEKKTKFVFEAKELTNNNKVKLVGRNDTLTNEDAYTLTGNISGNKLIFENLKYRYTVNDKKIVGRVNSPRIK